jgi:hypothetical protein
VAPKAPKAKKKPRCVIVPVSVKRSGRVLVASKRVQWFMDGQPAGKAKRVRVPVGTSLAMAKYLNGCSMKTKRFRFSAPHPGLG